MTRGQAIELGVVSLTFARILVVVGLLRVVVRGERLGGGLNRLDALMLAWGLWMVASVVFHPEPDNPFTLRMRDLYEAWGLYFLLRVFCATRDDIEQLAAIVALALMPIAIAMVVEKITGANLFARFGGVPAFSQVRNGVVRAQGPFSHAILAGSIGGVCVPLVIGLYWHRRWLAFVGVAACLGIVWSSGSSGPILGAAAGVGVLMLWRVRERMQLARWAAASAYLLLELAMNRPAYFIISDLDLMGGSTSWHRAELIRTSFAHFDEWWLVGTDYTRHWMASGVPASPTQIDITNHFLVMGVVGGVLLLGLFTALVWQAFWYVGTAIRAKASTDQRYFSWTVGASLFGHVATCLSVSYYDHSILFFYLALAASAAALVPSPVQAPGMAQTRTHAPSRQPMSGGLMPAVPQRASLSTVNQNALRRLRSRSV